MHRIAVISGGAFPEQFHTLFEDVDIYESLSVEQMISTVKRLCEEAFSADDDGFPGDEDNGTMAAWYIFSVLGLYPLSPGKDEYVKFDSLADDIRYQV